MHEALPNSPEKNKEFPKVSEMLTIKRDFASYDTQHSEENWNYIKMDVERIEAIENSTEKKYELVLLKQAVDRKIKAKDINTVHKKSFAAMGIAAAAPKEREIVTPDIGGAKGEILINLKNKNDFISFLENFNKEDLTVDEASFICDIAKKFAHQIKYEYALNGEDDRFMELVRGLKKIVDEYKRLGLDKYIDDLAKIAEIMSAGYLVDYVNAVNNGVFSPIGKEINASTYHRAYTPDDYTGLWQEAIFDMLDNLKNKKEAKPLYEEILQYAKDSIAYAKNDKEIKTMSEDRQAITKKSIRAVEEKLNTYL
ncbi:MAG: hypothetical protein WCK37_01300 [Candidatus Falkowbacteria bacterium]